MEQWQTFLKNDYADEIMIGIGLLFVLFGVMKIVSSSLKMVFWVIIVGLGAVSLSYGFQKSPLDLPGLDPARIPSLTEVAANADSDVVRFICEKFNIQQ